MRISELMTYPYTLTESDLKCILQPTPRLFDRVHKPLTATLIALLLLSTGYYLFVPDNQTLAALPTYAAVAVIPTAIATSTAAADVVPATPVPTPTPLPVTIPDSTFAISSIGISAPITWRVPLVQSDMNSALTQGVIHIDGTALPGEQGVVAIAGHSSNYPWIKSDYNSIFSKLPDVKIGQIIMINYNNTMYEYEVDKTYEVSASDVSVLAQSGFNGLHVITCVPVGTSLRRLVVEAAQVFPSPDTNTPFTPSNSFTGQLPSGL